MGKRSKIRWRKSDQERLENEIKKFNKKIYNVRHRKPELKDILPDTITKKDKEQMISEFKEKPRNEFKKELNKLSRFRRPGAEEAIRSQTGIKTTKWEKQEVSYQVATINRKRTIERKKREDLEATSRGEPIGLKRGEMGSERMNELNPKKFNFDKIKPGKEWEKFKETVAKQADLNYEQERYDLFKENYMKGLDKVFGDHAKEVKEIIEDIPSEKMVEEYFREQDASIEYVYAPADMYGKLDVVTDIWKNLKEGQNASDS